MAFWRQASGVASDRASIVFQRLSQTLNSRAQQRQSRSRVSVLPPRQLNGRCWSRRLANPCGSPRRRGLLRQIAPQSRAAKWPRWPSARLTARQSRRSVRPREAAILAPRRRLLLWGLRGGGRRSDFLLRSSGRINHPLECDCDVASPFDLIQWNTPVSGFTY